MPIRVDHGFTRAPTPSGASLSFESGGPCSYSCLCTRHTAAKTLDFSRGRRYTRQ